GRREEAQALLDRLASEAFADLPRDTGYVGALASLAYASHRLRDRERAQLLYDLLLPHAEHNVAIGFGHASFGAVGRYLGLLAWLLGRETEAARHFEQALQLDARMGARPWLAYAQREYAGFLRARGRPEDLRRATQLLSDARETAEQLGMALLCRTLRAPSGGGVPAEAGTVGASFRRDGEWWTIVYAGESFRLKDTKGVR